MAVDPFGDLVAGNSSNNIGSSTIIVQNGNNRNATNNGCLPCNDETVCSIGPSNGSRLDLSKIRTSNNQVRFNVDTTGSEGAATDQNMFFINHLGAGRLNLDFQTLAEYFGTYPLGGDGEGNDGSLISGRDAQQLMATFLLASVGGGATIGNAKIQYNASLYPQLDGMTISLARIPIDPNDALEVEAVYSPLCDFCTSSGNGSFTTHSYNASMPISHRQAVVISIPGATGGAKFTLDLCFSTNGFPNNEQTTWADSGA